MLVHSEHETKGAHFQGTCIMLSVQPGDGSIHVHIRGFVPGLPETAPVYIQGPELIIRSTSFHSETCSSSDGRLYARPTRGVLGCLSSSSAPGERGRASGGAEQPAVKRNNLYVPVKKGRKSEFGKRTGKQQDYMIKPNTRAREEMIKTRRLQGNKTWKDSQR